MKVIVQKCPKCDSFYHRITVFGVMYYITECMKCKVPLRWIIEDVQNIICEHE